MKTTMLDKLSTAIEKVVKELRGSHAVTTKKRMPLDEFVNYAFTQISKAAKEEPEVAKQRLAALKRSVDDAIAKIGKMAAEDTDSAKIQVEVQTAFAPSKTDGDTPIADLTTGGDQSSTEISVTGVASATGDTAFAESLKAVAKALNKLKAEFGETADEKPRKPTKKGERGREDRGDPGSDGEDGDGDCDGESGGRDDREEWPLDLNTDAFLKDAPKSETTLTWGADPDAVASPKNR